MNWNEMSGMEKLTVISIIIIAITNIILVFRS